MSAILKTLQVQAMIEGVKFLFDLRDLTPLSGTVEVTNVGEGTLHLAVSMTFKGDTGYERTAGVGTFHLEPGQSGTLSLGIMPPGHVTLFAGTNFDTQCEVLTIPSPANSCNS